MLAVASTMILSALPNTFELLHRYRLWVAAYELANEMQKARMMAVAGNTSIRVLCDREAGSYQLAEGKGAPVAAEHYLPTSVRFENLPRGAIRFHPRGTAAPAGSIALVGVAGRAQVIVGVAGRIRMEINGPAP